MSSENKTACAFVLPVMYYITHIVIGAVYLYQCPSQPFIPVYVLVLGCFCLVQNVLSCCVGKRFRTSLYSVTGLFLLTWIITGNVRIYSIYEPNYNKTRQPWDYCDKTVYLFAFWTTTLNYIILALCLLGYGCFCLFGLVCSVCRDDVYDQCNPDISAENMGAEGAAAHSPPETTPPHEDGV